MKKIIVTTTIHPVTEALKKFESKTDWGMVIAGDKKTPSDYKLGKAIYLTPQMQEQMDQKLSDAIGWNCIQRRNFAILKAYQMGADIIAVVDDDNIPFDDWGQNLTLGQSVEVNYYNTSAPVFDPIGATNHKKLWHRGFPLQLISQRDYSNKVKKNITPDIQADFWNGDPDIDAFCRMEHAPECNFDPNCFLMSSDKMAPFNSQNTFLLRSVIPDYFLFPHVGRMDDIWAAYFVQAKGFKVVFNKPSVTQLRNVHDLTVDMKNEYLGYEHNLKLCHDLMQNPDQSILKYLPDRAIAAFELYKKHFQNG